MQAREFDLELAFMAARARCENFEDERGAVEDFDAQVPLQIALLGRAERLVEDDTLRAVFGHDQLDLVGLAGADKQRRIGGTATGDDPGDRIIAC